MPQVVGHLYGPCGDVCFRWLGITIDPMEKTCAPGSAECYELHSFLISALSVSTCAITNNYFY